MNPFIKCAVSFLTLQFIANVIYPHFGHHLHFIPLLKSKVRHRCPMPATSILKLFRNFYETGLNIQQMKPFIKCAVNYLTLQFIVIFHSENVFSTFETRERNVNTK